MKDFYYKEEKEYIVVLNECFSTDQELLDKYHICAPADLNTCVRRTYYDLKNEKALRFFTLYCLTEDIAELIGFFGVSNLDGYEMLMSFFVKPRYRSKDVMEFFWKSVEEETRMDFYTGVYIHNTRAQKFLEKNNFKLINEVGLIDDKMDIKIYQKN
jgi:GNAT superfamily N-acetyltransferase